MFEAPPPPDHFNEGKTVKYTPPPKEDVYNPFKKGNPLEGDSLPPLEQAQNLIREIDVEFKRIFLEKGFHFMKNRTFELYPITINGQENTRTVSFFIDQDVLEINNEYNSVNGIYRIIFYIQMDESGGYSGLFKIIMGTDDEYSEMSNEGNLNLGAALRIHKGDFFKIKNLLEDIHSTLKSF